MSCNRCCGNLCSNLWSRIFYTAFIGILGGMLIWVCFDPFDMAKQTELYKFQPTPSQIDTSAFQYSHAFILKSASFKMPVVRFSLYNNTNTDTILTFRKDQLSAGKQTLAPAGLQQVLRSQGAPLGKGSVYMDIESLESHDWEFDSLYWSTMISGIIAACIGALLLAGVWLCCDGWCGCKCCNILCCCQDSHSERVALVRV